MLEVKELYAGYDRSPVLRGVSIELGQEEVVAVLGPNGMGKTTLIRALYGLIRPQGGRILFQGQDITSLAPDKRWRLGLVAVPERGGIFREMSVRDNLELAARRRLEDVPADVLEPIFTAFPVLRQRLGQRAGTLSGGEQRMLALAKALITKPRLLLLDEPSAGLAPVIRVKLAEALKALRGRGFSMLLCEQDASLALALADRIHVIEHGEITYSAPAELAKADQRLRAAYFGL